MLKSMLNCLQKIYVVLFLLICNFSFSQVVGLEDFLDDAIFFSNKFITPATDAAVYQQSSNWMNTPKKKKLWAVSLSVHTNMFFVPNSDRSFVLNNSDMKFFKLKDGSSSASVPTAMGSISHTKLTGDLIVYGSPSTVEIWTPDGISEDVVTYPYLQGGLGLWKGTELIAKYSTKVNLKSGRYQVYGFGVKHSLSQYFKSLETKKINIASLIAYSNEDLSFNFLDVTTPLGTLGLNEIRGLVDTYQFQLSGSKEWNRFEFMASAIVNKSDFKYSMTGPQGTIQLNVQDIVSNRLKEINKSKYNFMGEVSCRYQIINKTFLQSTIAFGKFVNSNVSVQYEF